VRPETVRTVDRDRHRTCNPIENTSKFLGFRFIVPRPLGFTSMSVQILLVGANHRSRVRKNSLDTWPASRPEDFAGMVTRYW
jgi:hypothetical protein